MALNVIGPGERKRRGKSGNKFCIARGRVNGRLYEFVCTDEDGAPTTNKRIARAFAREAESEIAAQDRRDRIAGENTQPKATTFREAADFYLGSRDLSRVERKRVERIRDCAFEHDGGSIEFGKLRLKGFAPAFIGQAANALMPATQAETKNREVFAPAAAVLHFAEEQGWCPYYRIRKLREKKPANRRPSDRQKDEILRKANGRVKLLCQIFFLQGFRVSEAIILAWDMDQPGVSRILLEERAFYIWIPKARAWKLVPMHPEVFEALANVATKTGWLFPWRYRRSVYRALEPLRSSLTFYWSPHMSRHWFGSEGNRRRRSDQDLVRIGSWTSARSVARYITPDFDEAREMISEFGQGRGSKRGESK